MEKIDDFFNIDTEFNDRLSYKRRLLVRYVLYLAIFVFVFFTFFNFFYSQQYIIALFDILAASFSIHTIIKLKQDGDIDRASKKATINFIVFFTLFVFTNTSAHFGLIWTIFLPIFAIQVNGRKLGLIFSILFYTIIFSMAYQGIGIWEDGKWIVQDFLRFVFASILLTYAMFMNEKTLENSHDKLLQIREKEKEYIDKLHKLSIIDPLTDLYNRRYFNEMSEKLIALANRKHLILTFFILDIDYFKLYNDNYGHQKGDNSLKEISKTLKNHIQREDDFVFRLGGEEFAGIILSQNEEENNKLISPICKMIEDLKIEHNYSDVSKHITASIGVATVSVSSACDIDKIYARADEALYQAKNSGRNKIIISS